MNESVDPILDPILDKEMLDLTRRLIGAKSVSPEDAGCQKIIGDYLAELGFNNEPLPFGDVSNLWSTHGKGAPYFVFAGHTDVVPSGPEQDWHSLPFEPTERDGELFGRGAADMKGSLAAMLTATKSFFLNGGRDHAGTIAFLITSDEEADAFDGTKRVMATLKDRGIDLDWCLIGEPSSSEKLGDMVRNGRRGSLHGQLTVHGIQGHVAYPLSASNPIHRFAPALVALTSEVWDEGNSYFPPTSMQVSNIHGGTGVTNVIPGELQVIFNFRYSTESTQASLAERTEAILDQHGLDYTLDWQLSGVPFLTQAGELIPAVQQAILSQTGLTTELSTAGGTSDGRFIAPTGTQVVELGPINATIHKVNESVNIRDLGTLRRIYQGVVRDLTLS
ncbi:MAG: succinyl-diaminopimelate desuccinylase [Candidatus Azotimanducaceae bacterium]|jgi:succinyl-diaminopimelate desuccinylase